MNYDDFGLYGVIGILGLGVIGAIAGIVHVRRSNKRRFANYPVDRDEVDEADEADDQQEHPWGALSVPAGIFNRPPAYVPPKHISQISHISQPISISRISHPDMRDRPSYPTPAKFSLFQHEELVGEPRVSQASSASRKKQDVSPYNSAAFSTFAPQPLPAAYRTGVDHADAAVLNERVNHVRMSLLRDNSSYKTLVAMRLHHGSDARESQPVARDSNAWWVDEGDSADREDTIAADVAAELVADYEEHDKLWQKQLEEQATKADLDFWDAVQNGKPAPVVAPVQSEASYSMGADEFSMSMVDPHPDQMPGDYYGQQYDMYPDQMYGYPGHMDGSLHHPAARETVAFYLDLQGQGPKN